MTMSSNVEYIRSVILGDNYATKLVSKHEYDMYIFLNHHNITPRIICKAKLYEDNYLITMKRYEQLFIETNKQAYKTRLDKLISKMHKLGIFHGDLHDKNIVVSDNDIRFIDFSTSRFIDELSNNDIEYYLTLWNRAFCNLDDYSSIQDIPSLVNYDYNLPWLSRKL